MEAGASQTGDDTVRVEDPQAGPETARGLSEAREAIRAGSQMPLHAEPRRANSPENGRAASRVIT